VAAALNGDDPLDAACTVASTLRLRGRLQAVRVLRSQRTRPGSLREHFDCGFNAADTVPTALFCASTAGGFAGALHKARCASGPMNAVQALTGALAGARFGAAAIPSRLLNSVPLAAHARVLRAAAALLEQPDGTLTSVAS
jgi:ADP-ribosylglycohydrolase